MKNNTLRFALVLMLISGGSSAEEIDEDTRMALANFVFETTECFSFYSIISNMESNSSEWDGLKENYGSLVEEMGMVTFSIAKQIQLDPEVLVLKAKQYTDEMGKLIGYDAINISLLMEKHGENCKNLVQDPAARLQYWVQQENKF